MPDLKADELAEKTLEQQRNNIYVYKMFALYFTTDLRSVVKIILKCSIIVMEVTTIKLNIRELESSIIILGCCAVLQYFSKIKYIAVHILLILATLQNRVCTNCVVISDARIVSLHA